MATNILASLLTARGADRDVLILLPTAYAALHFSYGLGFLRGLVKFRNRWGDQPAAQW
jgi:hypothetical protein